MILEKITISGADDQVEVSQLVDLSEEFSFVEWGILLSRSCEGTARYPSQKWIRDAAVARLNLSGHLCGSWLREFVQGDCSFQQERPGMIDLFQCVQLNFGGARLRPHPVFLEWLQSHAKEYIFQMDGINDHLLDMAIGAKVSPLWDRSGGKGISPASWPRPFPKRSNGYAGGIGPGNLWEVLGNLARVIHPDTHVWLDMESNVRDRQDCLDLSKVRACLEIARPLVRST